MLGAVVLVAELAFEGQCDFFVAFLAFCRLFQLPLCGLIRVFLFCGLLLFSFWSVRVEVLDYRRVDLEG